MELITAENLKAAIGPCDGIKSLVYMPAEARAVEIEGGGWVMHCGPYVLRSARRKEPRVFRTIDALVNAAKECGIQELQIGLTGAKHFASAPLTTRVTAMSTDWEKLEANRERIENECYDDILAYEVKRLDPRG